MHAVVARSTFRSQNVKSTRGLDHFWRFRCRFAWQAEGIVHLVKSEQNVRVLLHFQLQPPLHHTTFQYLQLHLHYIPLHYTTLPSTTLHYTKLHYATLHYVTLHYITLHYTTLPSTTLHYISLHYTPLRYKYNYNYTPLHSTTLPYTPLHSATLNYATLRSTTLQLQLQLHNYTPLH